MDKWVGLMQHFLRELILSETKNINISHTRLWSNIGMLSMTLVFLYMGFITQLPEWYGWIYATVVVAPNLISKLITLRWGITEREEAKKEDKNNE